MPETAIQSSAGMVYTACVASSLAGIILLYTAVSAWHLLDTQSLVLCALTLLLVLMTLTADRFLMPITKQRESRMLDLPLPFSPVMALKPGSNCERQTRCAYDLKPSMLTSLMYMLPQLSAAAAALSGLELAAGSLLAARAEQKV
jgi:hypothetical protein